MNNFNSMRHTYVQSDSHRWNGMALVSYIPVTSHCLRYWLIFDGMKPLPALTHNPRCSVALTWAWWRHQMETFSAILALCGGNSPVSGEFPAQMPVTRSFDVFFDLRLIKRLSKHSRGWWFETLSRHFDVIVMEQFRKECSWTWPVIRVRRSFFKNYHHISKGPKS